MAKPKITIIDGNNEIELSTIEDNVKAFMVKGEPGEDGVSPTITTSRTGKITTITIEDAEGIKEADINDGFDPTVVTSKQDKTTTVTITDVNGTRTTEIYDGIDLTGGVPTNGVIGFDVTELIYTCNGTEAGDYYFTYDSVSYYFTMPTVEDGDKLIFNTDNLELSLNGTTIVTSSTGTGTELTFIDNIPNGYEITNELFPGTGGGDSTPIGTIEPFAGTTIPNGYLLCDGSAVSRTTYADLFTVIGTTYGSGDGSSTFNLPNVKGRTVVMLDSLQTEFDTLGETGGSKTDDLSNAYAVIGRSSAEWGSLQFEYTPNSSHTFDRKLVVSGSSTTGSTDTSSDLTKLGGSVSKVQPYIVLNYIIKAYKVSSTPVQSQVVNNYSESLNDVYSCDYVNNTIKDIYSTDEIKTNKIWVDGKPIYRKVFTGSLPSQSNDWGTIGTIPNIDQLIDVYGAIAGYVPIPLYINSSYNCNFNLMDGNVLKAYVNGYTGNYARIVVEYTKTTD